MWGESVLDADGSVHGWCWCPDRPRDRQVVEVMINDRIASSVLATRFREDLTARGVGDGYHGFVVPLTKSLAQAGPGCVLSVRHQASGEIFWRSTVGEFGLPSGLAQRTARAAEACEIAARSDLLNGGRGLPLGLQFAAALGSVGRGLARASRRGGGPARSAAQVRAELACDGALRGPVCIAKPEISVIFDAGGHAPATIRAISAAAAVLQNLHAELIVFDSGQNALNALLPSLFPDVRYIAGYGKLSAVLRGEAGMAARGAALMFLNNDGADFGQGLLELAGPAWNRHDIVISALMAEKVMRLDPRVAGNVDFHLATRRSGVRLGIARRDFLNWADVSPRETALAMRALGAGGKVTGWREPAAADDEKVSACSP